MTSNPDTGSVRVDGDSETCVVQELGHDPNSAATIPRRSVRDRRLWDWPCPTLHSAAVLDAV